MSDNTDYKQSNNYVTNTDYEVMREEERNKAIEALSVWLEEDIDD